MRGFFAGPSSPLVAGVMPVCCSLGVQVLLTAKLLQSNFGTDSWFESVTERTATCKTCNMTGMAAMM